MIICLHIGWLSSLNWKNGLTENRHVHRADLHRGLLDAATNLGCKIRLNSRVVNIDPSLPALSTQDDKIYSADLIVASDGD